MLNNDIFIEIKKYYKHLDTTLLALNKFEAEFLIFAEQKDPEIIKIKENLEKNRISFSTLTEKSNSLYENYISALNGSSSDVYDVISQTRRPLQEFVETNLNTYLRKEKNAFEKLKNSQNSNVLRNSISEVYSKVFEGISQNVELLKASLQDIDLLRTNKEKLSELIRILLQVQQFHLQIDEKNLKAELEIENKKIQTKLKNLRESTEGQVFVSQAFSVFRNFIDNNNAYTNFLSTTATEKNEPLNKSFESEYILGNLATEGKQLLENLSIPIIFPFLYKGNLAITYKRFNSNVAEQIVNYVLSNALMKIPAGNLLISYVDLNNAGIGLKQLRNLDREILKVITEEKDFNNLLDQLKSTINRNAHLIDDTTQNIGIYNTERFIKNKPLEQTNLIVVSGYCPKEFSSVLNYCIRLGPKAGVNFIFQFEEEEFNIEEKLSTIELVGQKKSYFKPLLSFENYGQIIEVNENEATIKSQFNCLHNRKFNPISLDQTILSEVVENVNRSKEIQNGALLFENYVERFYPKVTEWFKNTDTAKSIDAAIGEDKNGRKQFFELYTTGEKAGLVHSLIFGATGRGKTVLLHSIITSLAIKYDPDYLNFYLIDLKDGTEFQKYEACLPHAKLIAKKSDPEFVFNVLTDIKKQIQDRANLFKKHGVKNINDYQAIHGVEIIPRLIIVLDEYQRLFEIKSFKGKIESLLQLVLKQGRSYGINIIFATQNPSDSGSSLSLEQIAVRIALPAPPDTFRTLFDSSNKLTNQLVKAGDALYNTNYGKAGDAENNLFKVYFLTEKYHKETLKRIREHFIVSSKASIKQKIFDGNLKVDWDDTQYSDIVKNQIEILLGEPMTLVEKHSRFILKKDFNNNILIAGGSTSEIRTEVFNTLLLSICKQLNGSQACFVCFNPSENLEWEMPKEIGENYDVTLVKNDFSEIDKTLEVIENEIKLRLEKKSSSENAIFILLRELQTSTHYRRSSSIIKKLNYIIESGSINNIYTFFEIPNFLAFKRVFDNNSILEKFSHKIALFLNSDSSYNLISKDADCSSLLDEEGEENKGLYYNSDFERLFYYKLYKAESITRSFSDVMNVSLPKFKFNDIKSFHNNLKEEEERKKAAEKEKTKTEQVENKIETTMQSNDNTPISEKGSQTVISNQTLPTNKNVEDMIAKKRKEMEARKNNEIS